MDTVYAASALFLLLTLIANIWRVMRGPTVADSILAIQIFGTTAVGILLLLSQMPAGQYLEDLALVFALLSAILAISFVRRAWADQKEDIDDPA